jgi:hypothetical protein
MALTDPRTGARGSAPLTEDELWVRFDRLLATRANAGGAIGAAGASSPSITIQGATAPSGAPGRRTGALSAVASGALGGMAALAVAVAALAVVAPPYPAPSVPAPGGGGAAPRVALAPPDAPFAPNVAGSVVAAPSGEPLRLSAAPAAPAALAEAFRSPARAPARLDERTLRLAQSPPSERRPSAGQRRAAAPAGARVIVRASGKVDTAEAVAALKAAGVSDITLRRTPVAALTVQARFFHRQDRARAAAVLEALGAPAAPSDFTHLRPSPPRGVVEVLLPTPHDLAMRAGRNSVN